ncbi:GNAT family N-acetyltransferase [Bacillus aquiflavi]|uniref:GNAT family N-acetyltransferase n=1 Tax=Bacillus aquiflavi TaxID=2672567 RepID=A0A6B3VZK7_9BACI|nr:GNAT family N-acetyltransferase [Bacillus aquiflavi]MBA4536406.1 GNAT family N-acetyltransferase [Bacillus aquiflavi]NEY80774.1 GNAT family N-acetyltransferase [Bacillus aquiflavi]UAC49134.1 GNAT family N-acetyltransferase [Bacillus aquiflavi]
MHVQIASTEKELNDAFSIRKIVFVNEQNVSPEEEFDQFEGNCTHFVLYDDTLPIGAGRLRMIDEYGKIERLCILKENRKCGAGKIIMSKIEEFAKHQQVNKVKLNAQKHAIPFYTRLGYQIISDEFLEAGIIHRTMEKMLD